LRLAGIWKAKAGPALKDIRIPFPTPKVGHYQTVPAMYNGMIAPLEPFAIKGALCIREKQMGLAGCSIADSCGADRRLARAVPVEISRS